MANEKKTDFFIGKLLDLAKIKYTPNGSDIKEIKNALKTASKKGTGKAGYPEFTAKSEKFIIVIEDKAETDKQANYIDNEKTKLKQNVKSIIDFAENGALHYANQIIKKTSFKKVFAFGCSGNEKHHIIKPIFVDENGYRILKKVENFENFSEKNIEKYYKEQVLGETPKEILEAKELQKKAAELHEALRNYGQLGDKEKPLVVSAILLALNYDDFKINNLTGNKRSTDGIKIFQAVENFMKEANVSPEIKLKKVLNQFNIIKDRTLLNQKDERLAKTPLKYFTEFIKNNILASIKANVKEDVLGKFYGEFMRYSGGDGQTLGVVLTPSHITELFCDLVDIKKDDHVFDPCCGTAGFLIAAMHRMENMTKDKNEKENIKSNQLHGIEIREDMFSIATTNMILRDDGKSNLKCADFLSKTVEELRKEKYTVGFMNPPYSQAKGKDTAHLSEINFTKHLLDSLEDGARCAIIVPQSTMVGKRKNDKNIKKQILEKHTLEGVITLNKETFYRIGTNPCIAIFTAHKPHETNKRSKFINFENDGWEINKHIGLKPTEIAKEKKAKLLDCWYDRDDAESKFMVKTTITDKDEWLHSFYYFNDEIPKNKDFEKTMADYLTFEFKMIIQGRKYLFENNKYSKKKIKTKIELENRKWKEFFVINLFKIERGKRLIASNRIKGDIPFITAGFKNEGVAKLIGNKIQKQYSNSITIDMFGNVFYREYNFKCDDNIHVLKNIQINRYNGNFITSCFKKTTENIFSYGKQFRLKTLEKLRILLPTTSQEEPDYEFMENYMRAEEHKLLQIYKNYISKRKVKIKRNIILLTERKWGEFEIGKVFNVYTGANVQKKYLKIGTRPRISATDQNNGIVKFTEISNHKNYRELNNFISVSFLGSVFYHSYTANLDMKIHAIQIKNKKLNRYLAEFIVYLIKRSANNISYGNQLSSRDLPKKKIFLPITSQGDPDYKFMEDYMRALEYIRLEDYILNKYRDEIL